MRFSRYAYAVIIYVFGWPFDDAKCFDVVLCAMGVHVAMKMSRVATFGDLGELYIGKFDFYAVEGGVLVVDPLVCLELGEYLCV